VKKIYIIGPAYPLRGGLSDFDMRLANEYEQLGYNVELISFKLLYPNFLFPGKSQFVDPQSVAPNLRIRSLINTINPFNWIKVGRKIKKERPDLIIVRYWIPFIAPSLGTILRLIAKNKYTKILAITDNVIPHEKRIGDTILTKYFVKSVNFFVCMSNSVAIDLQKFTNKTICVIPHPMYDIYGKLIDKKQAKKTFGLNENDSTILFFGFIREYKGLDILLKAMAHPNVRKLNIKLIIAGEYYQNDQNYIDLIKKLDIESNIIQHTEFIPSSEIYRYYSASDAVVLPYKDATQSGIVLVNFYFEKPMIVTNVGELPEVVTHEQLGLVAQPNADSIAEAIIRYFEENLEETFIQAIRQERKKYEWNSFVDKMLRYTGV